MPYKRFSDKVVVYIAECILVVRIVCMRIQYSFQWLSTMYNGRSERKAVKVCSGYLNQACHNLRSTNRAYLHFAKDKQPGCPVGRIETCIDESWHTMRL